MVAGETAEKKFFLPVKVLSRKFRGKFLDLLKEADLNFFDEAAYLENPKDFNSLITHLYQKEWVVYCKKPFGSAQNVISYLGRYTHRVAITNNRLVKLEDGKVTFKWRDYKDSNREKQMTLSSEEFSRRFLMHVLPVGFHKIRHYGLLAPREKIERIAACKKLTGTKLVPFFELTSEDLFKKILGPDFNKCPNCGCGFLVRPSPSSLTG